MPRGNATRENISKLNLQKGDIIYRCPKCVCVKPDRAHHCRFVTFLYVLLVIFLLLHTFVLKLCMRVCVCVCVHMCVCVCVCACVCETPRGIFDYFQPELAVATCLDHGG